MKLYRLFLFLIFAGTLHHAYCSELTTYEPEFKHSQSNNVFFIRAYANNGSIEEPEFLGTIMYEFNDDNTAEITRLNVNRKHRYKRIGTQLMLKAIEHIKLNKTPRVYWESDDNSIQFYKRFGAKCSTEDSTTSLEFIFERDGNPEENLKKYYANKKITSHHTTDVTHATLL